MQVRSECLTCTFRASCCSFRRFLCPGQEKKGGGSKGGPPSLAGTREYEQSDRNRWQCFEVLQNLECPVRLSQTRNSAHSCFWGFFFLYFISTLQNKLMLKLKSKLP